MNENKVRQVAIEQSKHWWYCDNIVNHPGECGLLRMDFPQVFILMRDYDLACWADYEDWEKDIAEVNFFNPADRVTADLDSILIEAWNFLSLVEEQEEQMYYEHEE